MHITVDWNAIIQCEWLYVMIVMILLKRPSDIKIRKHGMYYIF